MTSGDRSARPFSIIAIRRRIRSFLRDRRRDDLLVAEPCIESLIGRHDLSRVDPQAGQDASRPNRSQRIFKCLLPSQCLDGHVHATTAGQSLDFFYGVAVLGVQDDIGAEWRATASRSGTESTPMMQKRPSASRPRLRTGRSDLAQTRTTESPTLMAPLSAPDRPVEKMSGQSSTSSSASAEGIGARFAARIRHQQIFGPGAVDRVAETPAAKRAAAL